MAETRSLSCPTCASELHVDPGMVQSILVCWRCGTHVSILPHGEPDGREPKGGPEADAFVSSHVITDTQARTPLETGLEADADYLDVRIKTGTPGESLAVAALVLPLIVECILFLSNFDSLAIKLTLSCGAVLATAVMLAIDAHYLGAFDMQGRRRDGTAALLAGMILLWVVFYPFAYFRRRHFGRSNFGPLAIVVALLFVLGPFAKEMVSGPQGFHVPILEQAADDGPPACDSPDVKFLMEDLIRKGRMGPAVKSVGKFREIKHDRAAKVRRGRCVAQTDHDTFTITFEVSWIDPARRAFQVRAIPAQDDPRGYLGIEMARPDAAVKQGDGGVLIRRVLPGEAAERGGLKAGDIVIRINKRVFQGADAVPQFRQFVIDLAPGSDVTIEVLRGGERRELQVTIGTRPPNLP